jgi:hypothetical protein
VKGGEGGWDTASLMYTGLVPIIHYLTSSDLTIAWGEDAHAEVRVISRQDGLPREGIQVRWAFPGLSVPATVTGKEGISRVTFKPVLAGGQELVATVGLGDTKSLKFEVSDPPLPNIIRIANRSPGNYVGSEARIEVVVVNPEGLPMKGESVSWSYLDMDLAPTLTNEDGVAEVRFTFPKDSVERIHAFVRGGDTMSLLLYVGSPSG